MSTAGLRPNFNDFLNRTVADDDARVAYEDAMERGRIVDALVRFRNRLGINQSAVARRMGIKQPSVSGFETEGSDPRLSTLQRYARAVDAVLVWDVRPKLEIAGRNLYRGAEGSVEHRVNREEPSDRARAFSNRGSLRYLRVAS